MPSPNAIPSPHHRFLKPGRRRQLPRKSKQPSSVAEAQDQQRTREDGHFAITPRFSFGKAENSRPSPPQPALVRALQANAQLAEDVEDAGDASEDDEMLDDEPLAISVNDVPNEESVPQWTNDVALSPKRRRLDEGDALLSPRAPFRELPAPASKLARPTPRFTPQQLHVTQATPSSEPLISRPAFIRHSVTPQEPSTPLPEAFSPNRRGQKFIPGGMAATVQQWVLETGQAAIHSRRGQGYLRDEDLVTRVKLDEEVATGCALTARGVVNASRVNLLLAGGGRGQMAQVTATSTVGVRAPTWDITINGNAWTVGVDWRDVP